MRKVYIPTHNRADTITSHLILHSLGFEPILLVHDEEQQEQYIRKHTGTTIMNTFTKGLDRFSQILFILEELHEGQYILFAEDDIKKITTLKHPYRNDLPLSKHFPDIKSAKEAYTTDTYDLMKAINETIKYAEGNNYKLYGFSNMSNEMFMYGKRSRFTKDSLVNGALFGVMNEPWAKQVTLKNWDDVELSLRAMLNGETLIDSVTKVNNAIYVEGGKEFGEERDLQDAKDLETLSQMYDGITYKKVDSLYYRYKITVDKKQLRDKQLKIMLDKELNKWT